MENLRLYLAAIGILILLLIYLFGRKRHSDASHEVFSDNESAEPKDALMPNRKVPSMENPELFNPLREAAAQNVGIDTSSVDEVEPEFPESLMDKDLDLPAYMDESEPDLEPVELTDLVTEDELSEMAFPAAPQADEITPDTNVVDKEPVAEKLQAPDDNLIADQQADDIDSASEASSMESSAKTPAKNLQHPIAEEVNTAKEPILPTEPPPKPDADKAVTQGRNLLDDLESRPELKTPETEPQVPAMETTKAKEKDASDDIELIIAMYVAAKSGQSMSGPQVLKALHAQKLKFGDMEIFHRQIRVGEQPKTVFSIASMYKPGTLVPSKMSSMEYKGLSLFMQVEHVDDPQGAYDDMLAVAQYLADTLNAELKDHLLLDLTAEKISAQKHRISKIKPAL